MKVVLKFSPVARLSRYRSRRRMLRALGPGLAAVTTWSAMDTELHGAMAGVGNGTPMVHKQARHSLYESVIDRTRPIRMLAIGSFYGDTLQMWQESLHPDSTIVNVDVGSKLAKIADSREIHVRMSEHISVREMASEFGPFDVILDDGSATMSHVIDSFRFLFANALSGSGVYLVEDAYFNVLTLYNRVSFTDLAKALIDAIYGHYQVATDETNFRISPVVVVRRATPDLT